MVSTPSNDRVGNPETGGVGEPQVFRVTGGTGYRFGNLMVAFANDGTISLQTLNDHDTSQVTKHGTGSGYNKCRCEVCVTAHSKHMKKYRIKNGQ